MRRLPGEFVSHISFHYSIEPFFGPGSSPLSSMRPRFDCNVVVESSVGRLCVRLSVSCVPYCCKSSSPGALTDVGNRRSGTRIHILELVDDMMRNCQCQPLLKHPDHTDKELLTSTSSPTSLLAQHHCDTDSATYPSSGSSNFRPTPRFYNPSSSNKHSNTPHKSPPKPT